MIKTALSAMLETFINRVIALDPQTQNRFKHFAGKIIRIEITDIHFIITFLLSSKGVQIIPSSDSSFDTTIKGTTLALFQQLQSVPQAEIIIEGDVELGQQLRTILRSFDIDWEEHLAKYTGDMLAHQAGKITRKFIDWSKQTTSNLAEDLTSYLQEETSLLPTRHEVEDFIAEINELRHTVARLEARIQHINYD